MNNNFVSNNENSLINAFSKNNLSNIILIVCNIFNIIGNKLIEYFRLTNNKKYLYKGKNIFIISLIITLVVYIFFTNSNYQNIISLKNRGKEIKPSVVRFIGSILFIIGILCFIYYQTNENELTTSPET